MQQAAQSVASAHVGTVRPFTAAPIMPAVGGAGGLMRDVFGFALASSLSDPTVGYPTWDFSLLSTVAFFGLHVQANGTFAADSGSSVWNSSQLSGLLSTAHSHGTKVVLTLILQDFSPGTPTMCAGLANAGTTINATVAEVKAKGVDGVNVDYEGLNGSCGSADPSRAQHLLSNFVGALRSSLPAGSYLSVDTYASSAMDALGFFDILSLATVVDSFFVMAYDLEYSNYSRPPTNCNRFCLGPTSPLNGYYYNDTDTASQYLSKVAASKVILGLPYYGRKACVGPGAPNAYPTSPVIADSYLDATGESTYYLTSPGTYSVHRDPNDPAGLERFDTWLNTQLNCTRELYWDDTVSLSKKYDLVNRDNLRGVGMWNLNYGGGAPELWSNLKTHFACAVSVTATPGDQSATVSWTAPCSDGGTAITSYVVTAYDGCTIQGSVTVTGTPPPTTTSFAGLDNGTAYTFAVAPVNSFGMGPQSPASAAVTPAGVTRPTWVTACSKKQYMLTGSDGATWPDLDATNLSATFTPAVDSYAVLSGNADLWTANAGYNQDIGVAVSGDLYPSVSGQPEAWKESGGFAGTYSPNAAYVQRVISVLASKTYTAKIVWKASKSDPGTIFAGAGPIGSAYSPTRLTVQLIAKTSGLVFTKSSTAQYRLTGSNGATWTDMDSTNLSLTFTPPSGTWMAYVSGNADLWTSNAGYNQDIGVTIGGPGYPTTSGQPEAWKEGGGLAGTYSPHAAFVEVPLMPLLTGGSTYTAKVQWKASHSDSGSIWTGAGPIKGQFSPTTLTVILAAPTSALGHSTRQYMQVNSDGAHWQQMDKVSLLWTLGPGVDVNYRVSVNADLWTSVDGYNQDIGIMVSGGAYGPGTLVAWKESGGSAGTFSPNAAFVTTDLHLQGGNTYTAWAVWKTNRLTQLTVSNIWAGAGPISTAYSPTWLTAMRLS